MIQLIILWKVEMKIENEISALPVIHRQGGVVQPPCTVLVLSVSRRGVGYSDISGKVFTQSQ